MQFPFPFEPLPFRIRAAWSLLHFQRIPTILLESPPFIKNLYRDLVEKSLFFFKSQEGQHVAIMFYGDGPHDGLLAG